MKYSNYIFILIFILFSCNRKEDKKTDITINQETENSKIKSSLIADSQKVKEEENSDKADSTKSLEPFDIGNLPSEWIRLTETDSGMVIYNSCDGGNKLIRVTNQENKKELFFYGQQEPSIFKVIDSEKANSKTINFRVKMLSLADSTEFDEYQYFKLTWIDEKRGLSKWETTYMPGYDPIEEIFVSEKFASDFVTIEQPCIECWGDECDEIIN